MNLNNFIDGILMPRAEITLGVQETKGRVDVVLSLSSLLKSNSDIAPIFELLRRLTFKDLCITFAENSDSKNVSLAITFDEVFLRRTKEQAILLQNGYFIVDFATDPSSSGSLISQILIRSLTVKVSSDLVNEAILVKKDLLIKNNIKELSVRFLDGFSSVKGCLNKITSIKFGVDIYTDIVDNLLVVNLAQVNLMNFIAVPSLLKNIVIDLVKDHLKLDFVEIKDNCIFIDPHKLAGPMIDFDIRRFCFEEGFLTLELGKEELAEEQPE